jgi:YD repeat-containing protein
MVDSATTNYCYDELDRLTSTSTAIASCPPSSAQTQTGYRYDLDGNRRKLIYPDGMAVSYTLDAADRLQSLTDTSSSINTSYTYVPDSRLGGVSNANGTSTTYTWDNARRLQDLLHKDGTQTLSDHSFTLDPLGNRTHFSEQLPIIAGLAPSMGDTGLALQQLQDPSTDTTLDSLVAATTDAAQHVAEVRDAGDAGAAVAAGAPQTIPLGPPNTGQSNRELPLEDSATKPELTSLLHAEPTGHTLDVFDKTSPTASVQVQHAWTKASLRFELPGQATRRIAVGNKATATVGDLDVT